MVLGPASVPPNDVPARATSQHGVYIRTPCQPNYLPADDQPEQRSSVLARALCREQVTHFSGD